MKDSNFISLFLCGDVMTGRGIDQILPCAGDPTLHESNIKSAEGYLKLAENLNGKIPKTEDYSYIWGDAIEVLKKEAPDVRIINLETSVTKCNDFMEGKLIHYRMHPGNIFCLSAAKIDICTIANNHILDWGYGGLIETLETLKTANIKFAGAGCNLIEAELPAVTNISGKGRVIVFSYCSDTGGVPQNWAAKNTKSGVNLLKSFSDDTILGIKKKVEAVKQPGDLIVISIHWGDNWGYRIPYEQRKFAYALIDKAGIDIIYGHSSHHPKPIEVYKDKLIIYGAGDLINDYEGIYSRGKKIKFNLRKIRHLWKNFIRGNKIFRNDLVLMYFVSVESSSGNLKNLMAVPMQIKKFKLNYPSAKDAEWLRDRMNKVYKKFNLKLELKPVLILHKEVNTLLLQYVK
ncbi:MAG: CapA family protein [Ignavibacteriaceae bacterium]|jgi:poly-gamma-glutamate capsule biosynthesis protein CapA/YwtB (metallophosphatase superfamily)